MFHRVDREVQLLGDLLVGEAAAETAQHILLPHAELIGEGAGGTTAAEAAVAQHAADGGVDHHAVALHRLHTAKQMAIAHEVAAAESVATCGDRCLDRAEQRALNQHQTVQLRVEGLGACDQRWPVAAVQQIAADQQIGLGAAEAGDGVLFAGGGSHQGADVVEQMHQPGDQHPIGAGDQRAPSAQDRATAVEVLTHER